ncbi:MAG: hypothetical protein ACJ8MH_05340 [Povalibacter sp.]
MNRAASYFWDRPDLSAGAPFVKVSWALFAFGIIALGLLTLAAGDFAFQWQPVPPGVPARALLARVVGLLFIGSGICLFVPSLTRIGAGALAASFWAWELLLHVPPLLMTGENWLGAAELLALSGGSLALLGMTATRAYPGMLDWVLGSKAITLGKLLFAFSLLVFGYSHFLYAEPASQMIATWVPGRLFFTYLSGIGHIAAGLSLLTGVLARIAAPTLCGMFASFILFFHLPRIIPDPGSRYEWTSTLISLLLSGAAWAIAAAVQMAKSSNRTVSSEARLIAN